MRVKYKTKKGKQSRTWYEFGVTADDLGEKLKDIFKDLTDVNIVIDENGIHLDGHKKGESK